MSGRTWAVIENAGYEKEHVRRTGLTSYGRADKVMHELYTEEEIEELHVDIAYLTDEGWYSYDY